LANKTLFGSDFVVIFLSCKN